MKTEKRNYYHDTLIMVNAETWDRHEVALAMDPYSSDRNRAARKYFAKKRSMLCGKIVKIFKDPITGDALEGEAEIIRITRLSKVDNKIYVHALVNFIDDGEYEEYSREIIINI